MPKHHEARERSVIEVGVRELREGLSRFLEQVRGGAEIVVTDRGRPAARLVPVWTDDVLERLESSGTLRRATEPRTPSSQHRRARAKGNVADLVIDQRRR